jgi:hypothetical protein
MAVLREVVETERPAVVEGGEAAGNGRRVAARGVTDDDSFEHQREERLGRIDRVLGDGTVGTG